MKDNIEEAGIRYPTISNLVKIGCNNPTTISTAKIVYEFDGSLKHGDSLYNGKYYVYNDSTMPSKYLGVFVRSDISEDDAAAGVNPVHVVSMNNSKHKVLSSVRRKNKNSMVTEAAVPFKLKFPLSIDDITMKFLYLGIQNSVVNLYDRLCDERGMLSPIAMQVAEDWTICDKKLKSLISRNETGMKAVASWWNVCEKYYNSDLPFVMQLQRKHPMVKDVIR